jgi:dienelactone hydrolase
MEVRVPDLKDRLPAPPRIPTLLRGNKVFFVTSPGTIYIFLNNGSPRRLKMRSIFLICLVLIMAGQAHAGITGSLVEYRHGGTVLEGYLSYDDGLKGRRPGVLVIPDWKGVSPLYHEITGKLAAMGYVALAADIYGKGVRPKNNKEAAAQAGIYRADRPLMRARAAAGLAVLEKHELVDPSRLAVTGYCFGGGAALELARSGSPLVGAVSFHGNLDTPDPGDARDIQGKVLVLHGSIDPVVPPEQVAAFQEEMQNSRVDWQLIIYGGAAHAFTNPGAGSDPSRGSAYDEKADRRSWQAMSLFLEEVFAEGR